MTDFYHDSFNIVALVVIFAVGMAGGLVALGARGTGRAELPFSIGGVFAGGIFLGAGLIHLLPDSIKALTGYFADSDFPIGYLIAAIGFLTVPFIGEILFREAHERASQVGEKGVDDALAPASGPSAYALVVILSVHSVIAGAALGAEEDFSGALVIFIAIVAHKGAAGFALMLVFQRAAFERAKSLRILVLFASMTPLGIVLGSGLDRLLHRGYGPLLEGLFEALAAGIFLYVAIVEIIGKEFADRRAVVLKFAALCLGLALMAVIALFV